MRDFCGMNFSFTKSLFFLFILFSFLNANAQTPSKGGTISGKLVDAVNGDPLELANVSLVMKSDNKPVQNIQTDLQGNFVLTGVDNGMYLIRATYVSYLTFLKDSIAVTPLKRDIKLGNIKMGKGKGLLKEVVVSAQKSQIQLGIDKKSFNVEQSLVSMGGSATDLLSNVPSVQVDVDGNISLRGSTAVRVLINGKPSALTGGDISDILQSIPASAIETIEVITNPSSKYDAEGQSGIINIVLKKNVQKGFTGSASATVGTQNTYNGAFSLAYQDKKINVYSNYSYRRGTRVGNGEVDKITDATDGTTQASTQVSDQTFVQTGQNIRSGIDINLSPKTTLGFSNNINIRDRVRDQTGGTIIDQNGALFQQIVQNNVSNGNGTNLDFNVDFDHKFKKKGEEFTAAVGYSLDKNNNFDNLNTDYTYTNPASFLQSTQHNTTTGNQHNLNVQADYTKPLTNGKLEAGFRSTINNSDNNYVSDTLNNITSGYNFNPLLSNRFIYKENINAIYTNYQHDFGKFGVQGGLRIEDANISTQLITTTTTPHTQDYFRVYPSLFLTDKISDSQTLQLSYSRRVTRPRDRQLSPFIDESNRLNYQQGNPDLLPEDTHSFELSYINYYKTLTLTSSIYYRLTNDNIQQVTSPLTPGNLDTTITRFENIKSATNAGYELIAKVSPIQAIDLTANVNLYYRYIAGSPDLGLTTTSGYSWNGNLTANIKPTKKLGFQVRVDYQGPQVIPQGRMQSIHGVDGGAKYDISKKVTASMNVRDIFNTRRYVSDINYNTPFFTSSQVSNRRFATRIALFTLAYHFGNNGIPQKKKNDKNKDQPDQPDNPDDPTQQLNPNGQNNNGTGTGGAQPVLKPGGIKN